MSAEVVAWLESAEGDRWRAEAIEPADMAFGCLVPADAFSTPRDGIRCIRLDPAHDPCGRPPMGP